MLALASPVKRFALFSGGLAWTILAVALMARLPQHWGGRGDVLVRFLGLVLAASPLLALGHRNGSTNALLRRAGSQITWGTSMFLVCWMLAFRWRHPALAVVIFVPALCEEFVYRWMLPRFLENALRANDGRAGRALWLSCVAAQLTFAISHAVVKEAGPVELLRLFAAGLLFAELTALAGLWFAAAVHGLLNYGVVMSDVFSAHASATTVAGVTILGVVLLVRRAYRASRRESGWRPTWSEAGVQANALWPHWLPGLKRNDLTSNAALWTKIDGFLASSLGCRFSR